MLEVESAENLSRSVLADPLLRVAFRGKVDCRVRTGPLVASHHTFGPALGSHTGADVSLLSTSRPRRWPHRN